MEGQMETEKTDENRQQKGLVKNKTLDPFFIQQSRLAQMGLMVESYGQEWQQTLNHLSLLIQDIREALEFGELNDQYIDRFITESMLQINEISQTIHDFGKLYKPNKISSAFSVADAIEESLAIFSPCLYRHKIMVNFVHRGQYMAFGDPHEFSQAVLNVLTVAMDQFLIHGSNELAIIIGETDPTITAEISYNAANTETMAGDQIFVPDILDGTNGTRFSLYVLRQILESMGGLVTVENTKTHTKFCLSVPKLERA
ncbi:sensor histidine kinase [Neobacillus sp. Marseille-QA0830]